jgi:DNA gyrase/topoisomerase IV subunit A
MGAMKKGDNKGKNNNEPEAVEIIPRQNVIVQNITDEMRTSYLDYAMSVITHVRFA